MMKISQVLIQKIIEFEGNKLKSYLCPAGKWTIGIGHTKGVVPGQKITEEQSMVLFKGDMSPIEKYLNSFKKPWTQGEFDALADFCFNFGISALQKSTLLKVILSGGSENDIKEQFMAWIKARKKQKRNGKCITKYIIEPGLVKRRDWEYKRYFDKD